MESTPGQVPQALASTNKVLLLGSTVTGGLSSREAQAVAEASPSAQIDVISPEQWRGMTASEFMAYRAIILGDAACAGDTEAYQAAIDTRDTWGAIADGNVAILSTDPAANQTPKLVENAIRFVLDSVQGRTGMYISLGCAYQNAPAPTAVTLLEPFGTFQVQGVPGCASAGHMFKMNPDFMSAGVSDSGLMGAGCVARSVFTSYPDRNFSLVALAQGSASNPIPGEQVYTDYLVEPESETYFVGAPYVLVRGAEALAAGCGLLDAIPSGEECDLGDGFNGQPAAEGQDPLTTCSFSCRFNWCGDGVVDELFGEECDDGVLNGRSQSASGELGACTASCKLPKLAAPPPNSPPVALCQNVTEVAEYTCGMDTSIDNGSYDPDNNLAGCTQSPAGPYGFGDTTVTLTCTDQKGLKASCTGVVTVVDRVAPVVTLSGPSQHTQECNRNANYADPGYSASDMCSGSVPVTHSGTQALTPPGSYTRTYTATDAAGNNGTATRTILITDTKAPTLTLSGPATMGLECGSTFNDPGAIPFDQCVLLTPASVQRTGTLLTNTPGSYVFRYNVKDSANNAAPERTRTVNVTDTLKPTVTLNGPTSQMVECNEAGYVDPGASAIDQCAGALPVTRINPPNLSAPGTYSVSYQATDPSGNVGTSSTQRTVTVADTLAPTLTLNGPASMQLECGAPYTEPGAGASDSCAGDLSGSIAISGSVNTAAPGSYLVSYSVADPAGNSASASRAVSVVDTLAPQIQVLPGPSSIECNGAPYEDPGATASDACAGDLTASITTTSNLDQSRAGQYTVTYRVTDAAGNEASAVRPLTVEPCAACVQLRLNDYNLFLLEDYNGGHDVVGKVAVGGNITMENFAVGTGLPDNDLSNTLVAGGDLIVSHGAIWGDAYYGRSLSTSTSVTQYRGAAPVQGTPIDFEARFEELRSQSAFLASLPANGTTKRESWGGVMLRGTNSDVNVFDVDASAFTGAVLWFIEAPAGSFVVVNIRGASATFNSFGIQFSGGINQHGVLYNFVDTTLITAQGFGFWGTVLAPYAHVDFNNGSWDGGMYAKSFTGNAEGHINPLHDRDICR